MYTPSVDHLEAKEAAFQKWLGNNPSIAKWFEDNPTFAFAQSLRKFVYNNGRLTPKQLAAAEKCIERSKSFSKPKASNSYAGFKAIWNAVNKAVCQGLKRPTLRLKNLKFSWAKPNSRNPEHVYVQFKGGYAGKINNDGDFFPTRNLNELDECVEVLSDQCEDFFAKVLQYGKETGNCACCGRVLTVEESIERGIGPVCAATWFGA